MIPNSNAAANEAPADPSGGDTAASDVALGEAIGSLLSGFSDSLRRETRESPEYSAMKNLDRHAAVRFLWEDCRDRTVATALLIEKIGGRRTNRATLLLLMSILPIVSENKEKYRFDGLGGSTDRAFQDYCRALDEASRDPLAPKVAFPDDVVTRAKGIFIYESEKNRVISLVRSLEVFHPALNAFIELAVEKWGVSRSDRAAYQLIRSTIHLIASRSDDLLAPTAETIDSVVRTIFGDLEPEAHATAGVEETAWFQKALLEPRPAGRTPAWAAAAAGAAAEARGDNA